MIFSRLFFYYGAMKNLEKNQLVSMLLFLAFVQNIYAYTFEEVCQRAYGSSVKLIKTDASMEANYHEKESALAYETPKLNINASPVRGKDSDDSGVRYSAMLNFEVLTSSAHDATKNYFEQNVKTLKQLSSQEKELIKIAVKKAWLESVVQEQKVLVLREKVASAKEAHVATQKKFQAGRVSELEVQRVLSEIKTAQAELSEQEMELEHSHHDLQEMVMIDEEITIDDLGFEFLSSYAISPEQITTSPVIKAIDAEIALADAQMLLAKEQGGQNIGFGVGATHEPSQESVDFSISIPLSITDKNEKKVASLMKSKSALLAQKEITSKRMLLNINTLLEHLKNRQKQYDDSLAAQEVQAKLLNITTKGYLGGVVPQYEFLATKNSYFEAKMRTLEHKSHYSAELAVIEEKLGRIIK